VQDRLPEALHEPAGGDAAPVLQGLAIDPFENDSVTEPTEATGPLRASRHLELEVPALGYVESEVVREMLEQIEAEEFRVSMFKTASVALSATMVAVMSRAGSLVAMVVSSIPVWHRFDPLAVVAMTEGSRRAWAQRRRQAESDEDKADERLREMLEG
jgi:hypothetical protein